MFIGERWDVVTKQSICRICLNPKHGGKIHHDLLHRDFSRDDQNLTALTRAIHRDQATSASASSVLNKCLLPTARVKLSYDTRLLQTTALLNSGSNCSLVTKGLARRLKLKAVLIRCVRHVPGH